MTRTFDIDLEIHQQQIPESWQATYRKAMAGNRPAAVKTMCGQCQGWEDGARQAIRDCQCLGCPLHAVRPFQKKIGSAVEIDTDKDDAEDDATESGATESKSGSDVLADVKSKILDHLHRHGESQRGYIIFSTGIPESLWPEAIKSLLADGEVEREGEKRSTRYRLKERD